MNPPFSPYEYFSFLFPGAIVVAAWYYGTMGLPGSEPGAAATLAYVAAAFLVGHGVAAVASWLEPVIWWKRPGSRTDPTWGMFGKSGTYPEAQRADVVAALENRFPAVPFESAYHIGRTELQQLGKDTHLKIMDQQIGFYRNSAAASILAAIVILCEWLLGYKHFQVVPWLLIFLFMALLFAYRYRRFWRIFGDNVIRGVRALPPRSQLPAGK